MKQNKIPRNEYIVKPKGKTDPYKDDVQYTNLGQWKYPGQVTKIPGTAYGTQITMNNVPYHVYGEDNLGYGQMMYPGMDYTFPGQYVTETPMAQDGRNVNSLEADLITKVLMNRNKNKDFIQRAYALGQNPGMFTLPDPDQFGYNMSHKMAWGEDETGQAYMFPTVMNPENESIKVPNQYADYISSIGYKKETGIPYEAYGGDPSLPNIEDSGWLDEYQPGGVYTNYDDYSKAKQAYGDSLNLYNKYTNPLTKLLHAYPFVPVSGITKKPANNKVLVGNYGLEENDGIYFVTGKTTNYNNLENQAIKPIGYKNVRDVIDDYVSQSYPVYAKPKVKPKYKEPTLEPEIITPQNIPVIQASTLEMNVQEPDISPKFIFPQQSNVNNRISWRMDPETRKMVPVYLEGKKQKVKKGKRLYNEYIPTSTMAIPEDFVPEFDRPEIDKKTDPYWRRDYVQPKTVATKEYGGWLDNYEDEFKRGGQKGLKRFTSKNIQTSVNDIMMRNETIYGPSGKRRYKPNLKYQDGGQYSIVNYLAEKGEDFSKEYRKELADKYGVKDYDFSAEKNLELLDKLKHSKPTSKKEVIKEKPKPSYIIKPIKKENAKSTDRTGNTKKVNVPTKEQIAYSQLPKATKLQIAAQKNAQSKKPDEVRQYEPQGVMSKTWEALSHPMTALTALSQQGYIPDNVSQSQQPNYIDLALDVVNPAFYLNAIGRTVDKAFTPSTYSDLGKTAFYLAGKAAGDTQAPEGYDQAAMNTLALTGDVGAIAGLGQMSKAIKAEQIAARDAMYNNKITIGKGSNKTTVNNSKDFFDYFNSEAEKTGVKRKLKKKEVNFLNKEIKQRGVLEVDRKHPLDPRGLISKSTIIPENYNFKQLLKDVPKVLKESIKKGTPEDLYTMGHGRTAGWNTYLGLPTKNNPYRIHPESFTDGEGLLYTVPDEGLEKLRNLNNELPNVKVYKDLQQSPAKGIEELSFYKKMTSPGAMNSKQLQQEAYDKVFYDMENFAFDNNGDYFYKTQNEIKKALGPKKDFKYSLDLHKKLLNNNVDYISDFPEWVSHESDMFRLGDWDKYIGSHGGVGWKVKKLPNAPYEQWSMEDVWDINPFSRINKLPFGLQNEKLLNKVRRLDAGKILGGKDFKVRLDYLSNPETGKVTPIIPKKLGGEPTSHDNWLDDI